MSKYREKPVVIEAVEFNGDNIQDVWDAFGAGAIYGPVEGNPNAYIDTAEGRMQASPGDFIIRGVQGELYPCRPDIFAVTYEAVPDLVRTRA